MLTPEEIEAREFLVSLRGYDRDEVHSFLEQVARQIRDLQRQVESLQSWEPPAQPAAVKGYPAPSPAAVGDTSAYFQDLGKTTQRILEAAHEAGSEIQRKARNQADRELVEARSHAAKLVAEGQRRREVIEGVVHMLEERRSAIAGDLRGVARTVEQVLADLAPRGQMPTPDELLAVSEINAPDEHWVAPDAAEAELSAPAEPEAAEAELSAPAEPEAAEAELSAPEEPLAEVTKRGKGAGAPGGDRVGVNVESEVSSNGDESAEVEHETTKVNRGVRLP